MATYGNTIGPVNPAPITGVIAPGSTIPIVRDFIPPVTLPIVTTTILPDPKAIKATATKRISNQINIIAARAGDVEPYIFGRCLCEPTIIAADDSDEFLVLDLLWAGHECQEIEFLTYSNINEGLGTMLGNNQHFLGASGQVASTIMSTLKGSYDTLAGKTHSVISWRQAYGLDIKAMIKGALLRDPRASPQNAYSANPALCLARILEDSGYTCDDTALAEAANYCDEYVGSPQERRWEVGIQIRDIQDLRHWVQTFAVYSNCFVDIQGGDVYIIPDKPRASNHTVTGHVSPAGDSEMLEGSVSIAVPGARNVPEHVSVSYLPIVTSGPINNELVYTDPRTASTATTATPGSITSLNLPGIQSYSRARRLAVMTYNKSHNSMPLEFISFDEGLKRTVGDVGTITNLQYGLDGHTAALIENQNIERGRWKRRYDTYSVNNYSDSLFSESAANETSLLDPSEPPVGPTPSLTIEDYTDPYGDPKKRIKIDWTGVTYAYIDEYHVTVTGDDTMETVILDTYVPHTGAGDTHTVYAGPIITSVNYTVNVTRKSNTFAEGSAGTADIATPFAVTAKHFPGDGINYYHSPQYAGLLPATASPLSSDKWTDLTLVFCIQPREWDTELCVFGSENNNFAVWCDDPEGGFVVTGKNTGNSHYAVINASGSPSNGAGVWQVGEWSSVMISINGTTSSPETMNITIWGAPVGGGAPTELYNGSPNSPQFRAEWDPMGLSGSCYVGHGSVFDGLECYLSYVWCAEVALDPTTYWDRFFDAQNKPRYIGDTGAAVTGSVPATYCPNGDFTANVGTGPDWTQAGTVSDAPTSPSD